MGIDRPDEDDAPDVARDSLTTGRDSPEGIEHDAFADSDAEREAYSVKYRATVEARYQTAWDDAVPAFRQSWAEHERQYPHPERSRPTVQDDGSWRADANLKLKPEQNTEVNRGCERIRGIGEKVIFLGMRGVEAEGDGDGRHLVGLEHRFKGADRLKEKIADRLRSKPGRTPAEALAAIPDAVRFTFQYPDESYTAGVRKDVERLEARGFLQVERRNTWTSEQYRGINSRWREPESGLLFEVQFHTRISFEAKELTHKAYERIRGKAATDTERSELKAFQRQVCAMIPRPPGATEIEDYPPERRDG